MEGATQKRQLRPLRVKSIKPPQKKDLLPTEWLVPTFGVLCVALLQLPSATDFWRKLADALGGERLATVLLISVIPNLLVYYPNSFLYMFIDFFGQDWEWVRGKKIQPASHRPTLKQYLNIAALTSFNTLVTEQLLIVWMYYYVFPYSGHCAWSAEGCTQMPSFWWGCVSIVIFVLIEETGFYWTHRLVHCGPLYRWIHKLHHTFTSPAAMGAKYAHPVEHLLSNVGPLMLGPILLSTHPLLHCAWFMAGLFQTTVVHSGYHLEWFLPHAAIHDWHHEYHQECFSTEIAIWDNLCGTNKVYLSRADGSRKCHVLGVDSDGRKPSSNTRREVELSEESLSPLPAAGSPTSDPGDDSDTSGDSRGAAIGSPPTLRARAKRETTKPAATRA